MARRRIALKLAFIVITAGLVIAGLVWSIDDQALDNLKHRLSLWTLIALLLIINLVSFISFLVTYMAWKWVRVELKPDKGGTFGDQVREESDTNAF